MSLSPAEVEFLAEDELVSVVPKFEEDKIELIGGSFGPFVPQTPVEVPLWMAIELRKQQKCQIQCPTWLRKERLLAVKMAEKDSRVSSLEVVPNHYLEVASLILECASEDIQDVNEVRSLLEDIENLRQHKIRLGLRTMAEEQMIEPLQYLRLNNASAMEINSIRPILLKTLSTFFRLYNEGSIAIGRSDEAQNLRDNMQRDLFSNSRIRRFRNAAPAPVQQNATQDSQETYDSDDDLYGSQSASQDLAQRKRKLRVDR